MDFAFKQYQTSTITLKTKRLVMNSLKTKCGKAFRYALRNSKEAIQGKSTW